MSPPPDAPPCWAVVSSSSDALTAPLTVHGMLIFEPPSVTSIVRVPGVRVDLPEAPGLYVPVMSGRSTGLPVFRGSGFPGPVTATEPLSAPPMTIRMDGLSAPAGRSAGLSITPLAVLTVSP